MIDLHAYTTESGGGLMPHELIGHAAIVGVRVVAVTDRDTVAGIDAAAAVLPAGMTLVPGAEISCRAVVGGRPRSVRLLAYLVDRDDRAMSELLGRARDSAELRARRAVRLLRVEGYPVDWPQAADEARGAPVSRGHIAAALVAAGVVPTVDVALGPAWLGVGGPFHIASRQPDVAAALTVVRGAGGVAVLGHPCASLPVELLRDLAARGLAGIEVDHPGHDADTRLRLRDVAAELRLLPIGGSGYDGPPGQLGSDTTPYATYQRLIAQAAGATPIRA
ncbi:putative metal-dependent phosphoesterase, PHP family [Frankia torreyi]|uniref:Putative metal-dependent phosphoesterase, PHP family n=1 Tax=Frankia torreyi TaxID=1856 RepID=A0A0D8BAX7_9ACTN|nr:MULTISPECIES: PHP domain-containing protein [Frankia]KJE21114.1 putative metal-dependent phosphoesterase, PHP family [Frankia torreyi]KQM03618.1 putative metal-dependent phosphoesterase, PHP family [Frankia sp. CpI1-P]